MNRLRISSFPALLDLLSLFAGRIGGILATLVFIPQYNALLGGETFGAVSVVLSFQAFFLVSDLGLATLISRDTAIARDDPRALTAAVWMRRRAELLLLLLLLAIAVPGVLLPLLAASRVPWSVDAGSDFATIVALIGALVVINIIQLSLNALTRYRESAVTAITGTLVRGGATVLVLSNAPTLTAFLQVQAIVALVHLLVVRQLLERACRPVLWQERWLNCPALRNLLRRCIPLTVYTLAAAAAVNLDKPIISALVSLHSAGTYFLATTYALVPVAILSGPLNSYFAPRIAHARHAEEPVLEWRTGVLFQTVLMCAVVGPSMSLGLQMEQWLGLWLHDLRTIAVVMQVAPILLAGSTLSATGYYPTTYLIAVGDNGYLARLSLVCGMTVLTLAIFFASQGRLQAVAWSYFGFYVAGLVGLWCRMAVFTGWRSMGGFLVRTYLLPAVVIVLGYVTGRWLVAGTSSLLAFLSVPLLLCAIAALLVLAAMTRFAPQSFDSR